MWLEGEEQPSVIHIKVVVKGNRGDESADRGSVYTP